MIRIVHRADDMRYLSGHSVGSIRMSLHELFNIPDEAVPVVDGKLAPPERLLGDGQSIGFVVGVGRKGLGRLLTPEQLTGDDLGLSEKQSAMSCNTLS